MLQIIALVHNVLTNVQTVMPRQSSAVQLVRVGICMQYGSVHLAPGDQDGCAVRTFQGLKRRIWYLLRYILSLLSAWELS